MIFLDANVILSFLTEPTSDEARRMKQIARGIFRSVAAGQEEVTDNVGGRDTRRVLHLVSRKHYMQSPRQVATYLTDILTLPGFKLKQAERAVYLRARTIRRESKAGLC